MDSFVQERVLLVVERKAVPNRDALLYKERLAVIGEIWLVLNAHPLPYYAERCWALHFKNGKNLPINAPTEPAAPATSISVFHPPFASESVDKTCFTSDFTSAISSFNAAIPASCRPTSLCSWSLIANPGNKKAAPKDGLR